MKLRAFLFNVFVLSQCSLMIAQSSGNWSSIDYQSKKLVQGIKLNNINRFTFFLSGETHTVSSSPETKLDLIKYLYKKANVRNYVIEDGYAAAYLFNLYLKTGDESYICEIIDFYPYKEYRKFCRALYEFNLQQPEKIQVIGIDDNDYLLVWYKAMEQLFKNKLIHNYPKIDSVVSAVINVAKTHDDPVNISDYESVKHLEKQLKISNKKYTEDYKKLLGNDYVHFRLIIENEKEKERTRHTNKYMYANLKAIIKANQINQGNYYGQFGQAHVGDWRGSLTRYLNKDKDSPFYSNVFTIMPYYYNCYASFITVKDSSYIIPKTTVFKVKQNDIKKPRHIDSATPYILIEKKPKKKKAWHYILYIKNKKEMIISYTNCKF